MHVHTAYAARSDWLWEGKWVEVATEGCIGVGLEEILCVNGRGNHFASSASPVYTICWPACVCYQRGLRRAQSIPSCYTYDTPTWVMHKWKNNISICLSLWVVLSKRHLGANLSRKGINVTQRQKKRGEVLLMYSCPVPFLACSELTSSTGNYKVHQ